VSAYRGRDRKWRYRKVVQLPSGRKQRISGTPAINTRAAAESAERLHIEWILSTRPRNRARKRAPTENQLLTFAEWFEGRFWRE